MRFSILISFLLFSVPLIAFGSERNQMWNDLRSKREALTIFHQEFEISRAFKTPQNTQALKSSAVIDWAKGRWRERTVSGSGERITIFNGKESFACEDGSSEYVREKRAAKDELQPTPYDTADLDLSKAVERGRQSCGLTDVAHECVVIDIPIKQWVRNEAGGMETGNGGSKRVVLDTFTGLMLSSRTVQYIEGPRGGYQADSTYVLKRMSYNGTADESLFLLPAGVTDEVKKLPSWNAARIKKQLGGKTAPDLQLTDIEGKQIQLGNLKGRTVLLEFWATWCGPCLADGPSLDKLFEKYGDNRLTIIGISVSEERAVVEKFLRVHPHRYPVVLTTENEMPRAYQVGLFPTYVVINAEGEVASATEGDKGFANLRKLLKDAGLETDY